MYFSDLIKLRTVSTSYTSSPFGSDSVTEKTVFADKHSVKRTEFFAAQSAKMRADIGFLVRKEDYSNQTEVEYNSVVYDVIRTFEDGDNIDLTCSKR